MAGLYSLICCWTTLGSNFTLLSASACSCVIGEGDEIPPLHSTLKSVSRECSIKGRSITATTLLELLSFSLEKDEILLASQTDVWPGFISVEIAGGCCLQTPTHLLAAQSGAPPCCVSSV